MDDLLKNMDPEKMLRIAIATYILGTMMDTPVNDVKDGDEAKRLKVRAAFRYADMLIYG
jgi:hypothetical protein